MLIALVQGKGGVGKTTIATTLTTWLHRQGRRVVLLDADPAASAARWIHRCAPAAPVVQVPSSPDPRGAVLAAAKRALAMGDVVVSDSPPSSVETMRALIGLADLVVVPCGPGTEEIHQGKRTIGAAAEEGGVRREEVPCLVVLTRLIARTTIAKDALHLLSSLNVPIARASLVHRVAWQECMSDGATIFDGGARAAEAAAEGAAVCQEIMRYAEGDRHAEENARAAPEGDGGGGPRAIHVEGDGGRDAEE